MTSAAHATLLTRPGGMVYDDVLKITWLADANYAETSGYDADGQMNWNNAKTWADDLVYGGYSDWRLPSALNQDGSGPCGRLPDSNFNCTGSEMGYMFYTNLGGIAATAISAHHNSNYSLFINIQDDDYWSLTEDSLNVQLAAWDFDFRLGDQDPTGKITSLHAWAVRTGDVAVAAVPEPATALLIGVGAVGIGLSRRYGRRRR